MRKVFINQAVNAVSPVQTRRARGLASFLVDGILKWNELSGNVGATAQLTWKDAFTGETVETLTVTEGTGGSGAVFKVPYHYTLEISAIAAGAIIDAAIDGDV